MNDLIFEGVSTKRLLDQIARLRGWDPAVATPIQSELDRMCQLANHALERAWRFGWWPQLLLTRSVTYRPEWTNEATPYPLGEQVFWKGRYYECRALEGTSEEPKLGSDVWEPCERTMVCGISYVRYGIEELDLSQGVYTLDPDRRADARALPAARCAFGCTVMQTPDRPFVPMPYVRFRPYAPRLSAAPWLATTPYRKGDLVMGSDGESYEAWIDVPAGVDNGSYMKKKGMGQAAPHGGQAGDLIIVFRVEPHKIFVRDQFNLKVDLYVPYKTAVLGGVVKVPTIDDTFDFTIPEGTQSGTTFTVRGKGIKSFRGNVGNLLIRVLIEVPTKLSKDQKRELEKWESTVELKQCERMKKYADNVESLYGTKPYEK